jgi:hypothetical protein
MCCGVVVACGIRVRVVVWCGVVCGCGVGCVAHALLGAQAARSKKAPEIKALDKPAISSSLTKLAFVGDASRVRELLDPPEGKATADVGDKDV